MSLFQYLGLGHTFVQNVKGVAQKVKVVEGEIVNIEAGIHSDSRLAMAGFKKIVEGTNDILDAAASAISDVTDSLENVVDTLQDLNEKAPEVTAPETAPEGEGTTGGDAGTSDSVATTVAGDVTTTQTAPTIEVTTENDGKDVISVKVENVEQPKSKTGKNK